LLSSDIQEWGFVVKQCCHTALSGSFANAYWLVRPQ